jgi:hypothetical protein
LAGNAIETAIDLKRTSQQSGGYEWVILQIVSATITITVVIIGDTIIFQINPQPTVQENAVSDDAYSRDRVYHRNSI